MKAGSELACPLHIESVSGTGETQLRHTLAHCLEVLLPLVREILEAPRLCAQAILRKQVRLIADLHEIQARAQRVRYKRGLVRRGIGRSLAEIQSVDALPITRIKKAAQVADRHRSDRRLGWRGASFIGVCGDWLSRGQRVFAEEAVLAGVAADAQYSLAESSECRNQRRILRRKKR